MISAAVVGAGISVNRTKTYTFLFFYFLTSAGDVPFLFRLVGFF